MCNYKRDKLWVRFPLEENLFIYTYNKIVTFQRLYMEDIEIRKEHNTIILFFFLCPFVHANLRNRLLDLNAVFTIRFYQA